DEPRLDLSRGVVDADRPRLAPFHDHLPRSGAQLALDLVDPSLRRDHVSPVLAADLGEHREVLRQGLDGGELLCERDLDGGVGDLDILEVVPLQERNVLAQLPAMDGELEEAATAAYADRVPAERLELGLEVLHHDRRGPAELDDVDVSLPHLEHAFDLGDGQPLVEDLRETDLARLLRTPRIAEDLRAMSGRDGSRLDRHGSLPSTPPTRRASSDAGTRWTVSARSR